MNLEGVQAYFKARVANLILFSIACALALIKHWNASDLAWSLWLSNLFLTSAIIASTTAVASKKDAAFVLLGAGVFVLAIAFNLGQTVPLNATLPFQGRAPAPGTIKETYAAIFIAYWMWLPISFYHCRDFLLHPPNFFDNSAKATNPAKSLIFFNALVYVIILFRKILRLDGFAAAFFVYILYFFFFDRDFTRKKLRH